MTRLRASESYTQLEGSDVVGTCEPLLKPYNRERDRLN